MPGRLRRPIFGLEHNIIWILLDNKTTTTSIPGGRLLMHKLQRSPDWFAVVTGLFIAPDFPRTAGVAAGIDGGIDDTRDCAVVVERGCQTFFRKG